MPVVCPSQLASPVASFLTAVLPDGKGLVLILRFYADESGDDENGIFRVAGYLMTDKQWKSLDKKIGRALGDLPWFHMKEGHHRRHPKVYRKLLRAINPNSVLAGFSVSVNKREYDSIVSERIGKQPLKYWFGSMYAFLIQAVMSLCGEWCTKENRADEWIAYFFEAGHPSEGDANVAVELMKAKQYKQHAETARYASHAFLAKQGPLSKALIPCDILAWHLTKWRRGGNQCKELIYLLKTRTQYEDFTSDDIRKIVAKYKERWKTHDKHGKPRRPIPAE
jgi:hypothetical protein